MKQIESDPDFDQLSIEQDESKQISVPRNNLNNTQEFYFPLRLDTVEQAKNIQQILISLNDQRVKFTKKKIRNYLYLKCKFCSSRITYRIDSQENYTLFKFDNHHLHKTTRKDQQLQFKRIFDANQKIYCPRELKNLITVRLGISNRRYHYLLSKLYSNKKFQQIVQELAIQNWQVFTQYGEENTDIPELFFGMSPEMKSWAHQFGDSIAYDVTYNMLLNPNKKDKIGVYFFTGFDTNLRVLPLALGFLTKQTTQNFMKIFLTFFETIRWSGMTIISDEQQAIKSALNNLKEKGSFKGNHIYDCFHYLRTLNRKVSNEKDYQLFYRVVMSKSKRTSQNSLQQLKISKTVNKVLLSGFLESIQRYSYSLSQCCFIGLNNCSNRAEKMNDMIKKYIPYEVSFARFFSSFKKLLNSRASQRTLCQQKKKYELLFKDQGIQKVRRSVEKKIFNFFLGNYIMASRIQTKQVSQNNIGAYQIRNEECDCENTQKQGIPCQHLIRYLWEQCQFTYLKYFNKRWIVQAENSSLEMKARGRPKISRRNK